jgi:hypothetical protein
MDRRKAMKVAAGVVAGSGAGLFTLANAFKPKNQLPTETYKLEYNPPESNWAYFYLDPDYTAELAYKQYSDGSCMYAAVRCVVSQLAEIFGEPYTSFPNHMFKYGNVGIAGYGSVCGALNGAAAVVGLLVTDKKVQDRMITDLFQWYEKESLPKFSPANPVFDFSPAKSSSNSVLCHASNANWCKESGHTVNSDERRERCRRLTCDVARKTTTSLNEIFTNAYITNVHSDEKVNSCIACHGDEGKLKNTASKMSCNSCHSESIGHRIFSDVHYKFMQEL